MPTFRILSQDPVYFKLDGVTPAALGYLNFYDSGTTTPKDVYGDPAMSVNNGPTVALGSDGRAVHDLWGNGVYRVRVYASDNTLISEADNVQLPGGSGSSLPSLIAGNFLTNDGSVALWGTVRQVPDPTGSANKILGTDGSSLIWQTAPVAPTAPIVGTAGKVVLGTGANAWMEQIGTSTGPASGTYTITKSVTFPTAFSAIPFVSVTVQTAYSGGPVVAYLASPPTTTGFSVTFDVAEGNSGNSIMNSDVAFAWKASGNVSV